MGLETINDGAAKNDKENQKKIMPLIMQQAARMENIVNDLLSLSRIELQEHIRPNDNVVLDEIIKHSVDLHKDLLQKNSITCKIETENKKLEQEKLELKKQKEQVATKNTETFKRKRRRKPNELITTSSTGLKGNKLST